jgi:flagella basal body P-ring formation protein FlgA
MEMLKNALMAAFVGFLTVSAQAQVTQANEAPRDPASLARDSLRSEARAWVATQTGAHISWVSVASLDARVAPPACDTGYRFDFPFESRATVRANCDRPSRQFYMRVNTERPKQRLVAARPLSAGTMISAGDLAPREGSNVTGGIDDPALVAGRFLRRSLEQGEAPSVQDFEDRVPVIRTTRDLRTGETLDMSNLRVEMTAKSRAPSASLANVEELKTARLRRDVPADRVLTADDLIDPRTVVVAKRNLLRGENVDAGAFDLVQVDRRQLPPDFITDSRGILGAEVTSPIRTGEPLRSSQIRPALMVRKGQPVILTVSLTGLEISFQAEALEDARLGDPVKLRNPDSGKTLAATVTGRGTARSM